MLNSKKSIFVKQKDNSLFMTNPQGQISLKVLKEIAQKKVFGSLDAQMTIREWKNGNLKNFYTL